MTPAQRLPARRPARPGRLAACAAGWTLACLLAAPAALAAEADPTPAAVRRLLADAATHLVDADVVDGQTLPETRPEPFLDRLGVDLPCGSPVVAEVRRSLPSLSETRRAEALDLIAPPQLATSVALPVLDAGVVVMADLSAGSRHGVRRRDADRDGVPDVLAALAADARAAVTAVDAALAWNPGQRPAPVRVVLAESDYDDGLADGDLVVLPRALTGPARRLALAHQLAHLALADLEPDLPVGFAEAMALRVGRDAVAATGVIEPDPLPRAAARALFSPGLLAARDDAAFLAHAARVGDLAPGWEGELVSLVTRRLDAERGAAGTASPAAARRAVAESLDDLLGRRGSSLADAVSTWHVACAVGDLARDGADTAVDVSLPTTADVDVAGSELPPFARLRFGLEIPERGGLKVAFDGDDRAEGTVVALVDDGRVLTWPLVADPAGERRLSLPAAHLVAALAVVQAPALPEDLATWDGDTAEGGPGSFSLAVESDPRLPVTFAALSARVAPGQVTVEWTTSSEDGLSGWLVERAARPAGPWRLLSPLPLPAYGIPGERGSYAFVDPTVEPDTVVHYRLRAGTAAGLSELSPVLSVRTLPAGPRTAVAR